MEVKRYSFSFVKTIKSVIRDSLSSLSKHEYPSRFNVFKICAHLHRIDTLLFIRAKRRKKPTKTGHRISLSSNIKINTVELQMLQTLDVPR